MDIARLFWFVIAAHVAISLPLAFAAPAALESFYPLGYGTVTNGVWSIYADTPTLLRVFGPNLANTTELFFTFSPTTCEFERHNFAQLLSRTVDFAEATVRLPLSGGQAQYFCLDGAHQGTLPWVTIAATPPPDDTPFLPFGVQIFLIVILLFLSGLFSGLNLGLMSLDTTELKIVMAVGTETEQRYARAIMPLRKRGNMLLCTVLLGNVIVNSSLTILLDGVLGSGLFAVLGAAFSIVVIGEIFPQALCTRHALWVGAHTIWLMRFFMLLTLPVSYPVSLLLDWLLGEEIGAVYQRKQLIKLIQLTKENIGLGQSEFAIVTGALTYREKTAGQIMTELADVFMVDLNSKLDYRTMTQITQAGHSRIPVFSGSRENIVGLLFVRDLTFVDPTDSTPLEAVIKHYNHPLEEVYDDTRLDELLDFFRQGRTHMCMVLHIDASGCGDPRRLVVGIVTLEDVIEEIIQAEIFDEKDEAVGARMQALQPFTTTATNLAVSATTLSDQFTSALLAFLAKYPQFDPMSVPQSVVRLLLQKPGVVKELYRDELAAEERMLYKKGQQSNTFTLVLEGRVKVVVGTDLFSFESGPFTPLALESLQSQHHYIADFSAEIVSERVLLMCITRAQYVQLVKASRRVRNSSHSLRPSDAADVEAALHPHLLSDSPPVRGESSDGAAAGGTRVRLLSASSDLGPSAVAPSSRSGGAGSGAGGSAASAAVSAAEAEDSTEMTRLTALSSTMDDSHWDGDHDEHTGLIPQAESEI